MNRGTHEQEIEVELLDPEEIEAQEEDADISALALDGDLIEALYQEQMQEQQAEEAETADGTGPRRKNAQDAEERSVAGDSAGKTEKGSVAGDSAGEAAERSVAGDSAGEAAERSVAGDSAGDSAGETADEEDADMVIADIEDLILKNMTVEEENPEGTAENDADASERGSAGGSAEEAAEEEPEEGSDEEAAEGETEGKPKRKKSILRRVLKGVLITFEVLILAFIVYVVAIVVQADSTTDLLSRLSQSMLGKAVLSAMIQDDYEGNVQETVASGEISTNEGLDVTPYSLEGDYTSFVIFGVDAREDEFDSGTNSDTIIIVTLQNETGRVRMASIYRDTYLQIQSGSGDPYYAKANSAYSSGGAVRALNMLNTNFDLALEDYVVVNFTGVADIIDELGGLDITLSEGEVSQLNYHLAGSIEATGLTASKITSAGLNHLNGVQALTYARIRKTAFTDPDTGEVYNNDYGRTKRQQYVISLLAAKAKTASVSELTAIVNRVFSYNTDEEKVIGTTYDFDEIISMIPLALNFYLDGGEGYPDNKTTSYMSDLNGADCVIATDLVSDVSALHEFLYDEEDYSPTATVRNIADTIVERMEIYGSTN